MGYLVRTRPVRTTVATLSQNKSEPRLCFSSERRKLKRALLITKKINCKITALLEPVSEVRAGVRVQQGNLELKARQAPARRDRVNRLSKRSKGRTQPRAGGILLVSLTKR